MAVKLSASSKKLIEKLYSVLPHLPLGNWVGQDSMSRTTLIDWLKEDIALEESELKHYFLIECLRAALLEDVFYSFLTEKEKEARKKKSPSLTTRLLFGFLTLAGTILAICNGFDGVVSVLTTVAMIPASMILAAGAVFSLLSVIVFYGFDFIALSNNLGIQISQSPRLIDVLLEQTKQIKNLRKEIDSKLSCKDEKILLELLSIVSMLKFRFDALESSREHYKNRLQNPYLNIAKLVTALIAGILFFAGGFFSGQSLALVFAGLFSASVTAAMFPVVLTSIITGVGAFSLYWFVERPGLENLLGRWFGLDKDKIDELASEEVVEKQTNYLNLLQKKLESRLEDCREIKHLKQRETSTKNANVIHFPSPLLERDPAPSLAIGRNPHCFLRPSRSADDLMLLVNRRERILGL
ncbi:coiled-coil protein (plasmid) [Legionella adelaidensis]|uniref:Coiled-coil protein n=2 Tax=Legionella adelaidensis TaxID=45056 RepID=A0A0W0R0G3_9GAMM|nr:coiled-coil protein [Legionella adelaidensis]VEH85948.1 coiled-coil protein [Legionella adelaidensis]